MADKDKYSQYFDNLPDGACWCRVCAKRLEQRRNRARHLISDAHLALQKLVETEKRKLTSPPVTEPRKRLRDFLPKPRESQVADVARELDQSGTPQSDVPQSDVPGPPLQAPPDQEVQDLPQTLWSNALSMGQDPDVPDPTVKPAIPSEVLNALRDINLGTQHESGEKSHQASSVDVHDDEADIGDQVVPVADEAVCSNAAAACLPSAPKYRCGSRASNHRTSAMVLCRASETTFGSLRHGLQQLNGDLVVVQQKMPGQRLLLLGPMG